jgi:hypothetical protein
MLKPFPQNLDTAREFQAASQTCYRLSYPWVVATVVAVLVLGLVVLIYQNTTRLSEFAAVKIGFVCVCVVVVSIIRIALLQNKYFICPACGTMPTTNGAVLLNPTECPRCGARLK